jgi:hypothetical protein
MLIAGTAAARPLVDEVVIRRGDPLPAPTSGLPNTPAARFVRVYTNDVFALQGAVATSYNTSRPDEVRLRFQTFDLAKLADGVLKDTVLGARMVYADPKGVPYDMTQPASDWVSYPTNYLRNVAAMPDVVRYRWIGPGTAILEATTPEARVRVQQLVERKLGGVVTAYWKGECFGPKCPPAPAPPTGEA